MCSNKAGIVGRYCVKHEHTHGIKTQYDTDMKTPLMLNK